MKRACRMAAAFAAAAALASVPAAARAEVSVGTVDIVEVMNNYQRTKDASAELQVDQARLRAASEQKVRKIEELRNQRDGFNKGTEEWKRLDEEALQAEIALRTEMAFEQAKLERRHQGILRDMYREIQEAVRIVADRQGLDLVYTKAFLSPPQIDLEEARGLEDLKARIVAQRLIFPADPVDVTSAVLKKLNDDYKARNSSAGSGVPKG